MDITTTTDLAEHIRIQNLELQRKNLELTQVYSDLRQSFETLSELNIKLRAINEELKLRSKIQTEFINIAAHELRTPTQSIIGYCEMLAMYPSGSKDYLERLARNADRLYTLISDLLDANKIDLDMLKITKSDFNLIDIIHEVVNDRISKPYYSTKNNSSIKTKPNIKLNLPSHPIIVHGDKYRITQVLSNLLDNAIKFTKSGIIIVSIKLNVKNLMRVSVKDNGKGIDSQIQSKLFEKFTTMSDTGIGLGLFISKKIIEAHGGTISGKNNEDGSGATFSFTLPTITAKNK
ncbi:MAG TPA: HAMP domain-containing sensor histidine kinase [Nitrososphaeraceae archaeon]|nr:HAMP domain-containing sensor histidine kinase [Nitrososphaeraceae archaeon]